MAMVVEGCLEETSHDQRIWILQFNKEFEKEKRNEKRDEIHRMRELQIQGVGLIINEKEFNRFFFFGKT